MDAPVLSARAKRKRSPRSIFPSSMSRSSLLSNKNTSRTPRNTNPFAAGVQTWRHINLRASGVGDEWPNQPARPR